MSNFFVIDQIEIGHEGPIAIGPKPKKGKPKKQLIHLMQGSMDGACGPYSMMMALLICGLIDRDDLVELNRLDGRKRGPGKLFKLIQKYQGLFRYGTDIDQLKEMLEKSYKNYLNVSTYVDTDVDVKASIVNELNNNNPVIIDLDYSSNDGHWVVAIGYEYLDESDRKPIRFLLLDPNSQSPIISPWNGVVDTIGSGGRYPYIWWGKDSLGNNHPKVKFTCALALSKTY